MDSGLLHASPLPLLAPCPLAQFLRGRNPGRDELGGSGLGLS